MVHERHAGHGHLEQHLREGGSPLPVEARAVGEESLDLDVLDFSEEGRVARIGFFRGEVVEVVRPEVHLEVPLDLLAHLFHFLVSRAYRLPHLDSAEGCVVLREVFGDVCAEEHMQRNEVLVDAGGREEPRVEALGDDFEGWSGRPTEDLDVSVHRGVHLVDAAPSVNQLF